MAACPVCGLEEETIALGAARDSLRSFPRRYREATSEPSSDVVRARPDPSTWSILEYVVHTCEVLSVLAGALTEVLARSDVEYPDLHDDDEPGSPADLAAARPAWIMDLELSRSRLDTACGSLVATIDATPMAAWDRRFTIGATEHVAEWIPRHAAHEGAHHLRDIERVSARFGP